MESSRPSGETPAATRPLPAASGWDGRGGSGPALPALLFLHGGGWVVGDLDGADPLCRALANRAGCLVVSIDYPLAPEHRFPAALEASYGVVRWIHAEGARIGADPERIAVGGES